MSSEVPPADGPSGLGRRDFVKRSALLGGMVWAAPAISTFGGRAFAAQGTGPGIEFICQDRLDLKAEQLPVLVGPDGEYYVVDESVADESGAELMVWALVPCGGTNEGDCRPDDWEPATCVTDEIIFGDEHGVSTEITGGSLVVAIDPEFDNVARITLPQGATWSAVAKAGSTREGSPSGGGCYEFSADGTTGTTWRVESLDSSNYELPGPAISNIFGTICLDDVVALEESEVEAQDAELDTQQEPEADAGGTDGTPEQPGQSGQQGGGPEQPGEQRGQPAAPKG